MITSYFYRHIEGDVTPRIISLERTTHLNFHQTLWEFYRNSVVFHEHESNEGKKYDQEEWVDKEQNLTMVHGDLVEEEADLKFVSFQDFLEGAMKRDMKFSFFFLLEMIAQMLLQGEIFFHSKRYFVTSKVSLQIAEISDSERPILFGDGSLHPSQSGYVFVLQFRAIDTEKYPMFKQDFRYKKQTPWSLLTEPLFRLYLDILHLPVKVILPIDKRMMIFARILIEAVICSQYPFFSQASSWEGKITPPRFKRIHFTLFAKAALENMEATDQEKEREGSMKFIHDIATIPGMFRFYKNKARLLYTLLCFPQEFSSYKHTLKVSDVLREIVEHMVEFENIKWFLKEE